jgi:hypothetical protein
MISCGSSILILVNPAAIAKPPLPGVLCIIPGNVITYHKLKKITKIFIKKSFTPKTLQKTGVGIHDAAPSPGDV